MEEKNTVNPVCEISGIVIHGRGIGKLVGTPTANLKVKTGNNGDGESGLPELGVWISRVFLKGKIFFGVTHIGKRPTIDDSKEISVEVYILNFNQDIYGCGLKLQLFKKIRDPKRFDDLSLLLEQIRKDCCATREYWGIRQNGPGLSIDITTHQVRLQGKEIRLSLKEFDVLYLLYSAPDAAFTKKQIYEAVWHEPANNSFHAVENTVFQIRKRLKEHCPGHDYIKTLVGYGYQYCAENEIFE